MFNALHGARLLIPALPSSAQREMDQTPACSLMGVYCGVKVRLPLNMGASSESKVSWQKICLRHNSWLWTKSCGTTMAVDNVGSLATVGPQQYT